MGTVAGRTLAKCRFKGTFKDGSRGCRRRQTLWSWLYREAMPERCMSLRTRRSHPPSFRWLLLLRRLLDYSASTERRSSEVVVLLGKKKYARQSFSAGTWPFDGGVNCC